MKREEITARKARTNKEKDEIHDTEKRGYPRTRHGLRPFCSKARKPGRDGEVAYRDICQSRDKIIIIVRNTNDGGRNDG